MRFHVGSDHGGVELRRVLVEALAQWGCPVVSESGPAPGEKADYPQIAAEVCRRVVDDRAGGAQDVFGLLICGTGQGVAMAANKVPGIRAGVVLDGFSAKMLRAHNDANVLCIGERVAGPELAKYLLRQFIDAEFEGGRHARRVALIDSLSQCQSESGSGTGAKAGEGS